MAINAKIKKELSEVIKIAEDLDEKGIVGQVSFKMAANSKGRIEWIILRFEGVIVAKGKIDDSCDLYFSEMLILYLGEIQRRVGLHKIKGRSFVRIEQKPTERSVWPKGNCVTCHVEIFDSRQ